MREKCICIIVKLANYNFFKFSNTKKKGDRLCEIFIYSDHDQFKLI